MTQMTYNTEKQRYEGQVSGVYVFVAKFQWQSTVLLTARNLINQEKSLFENVLTLKDALEMARRMLDAEYWIAVDEALPWWGWRDGVDVVDEAVLAAYEQEILSQQVEAAERAAGWYR